MGSNRWNEAIFVDGEFRAPSGGGVLSVRDKASGEIFAVAGLADAGRRRRGGRQRPGGPAGVGRGDLRGPGRGPARGRGGAFRPGGRAARADHARDRLHRRQGRLRDRRGDQRADRGGGARLPLDRRTGADHAPRAPVAVRTGPGRPGRRDHPVELPAGARHAGDRARRSRSATRCCSSRRRRPRCPAGSPSPSCSPRPGCPPGSSRCCRVTSRWASAWSPTRTSR